MKKLFLVTIAWFAILDALSSAELQQLYEADVGWFLERSTDKNFAQAAQQLIDMQEDMFVLIARAEHRDAQAIAQLRTVLQQKPVFKTYQDTSFFKAVHRFLHDIASQQSRSESQSRHQSPPHWGSAGASGATADALDRQLSRLESAIAIDRTDLEETRRSSEIALLNQQWSHSIKPYFQQLMRAARQNSVDTDTVLGLIGAIERVHDALRRDVFKHLQGIADLGVDAASQYLAEWNNFKTTVLPTILPRPAHAHATFSPEAYAALRLPIGASKAEILGLTPQQYSDQKTRDKAYKGLALRWHPDKNREQAELATKVTQLINWAAGK